MSRDVEAQATTDAGAAADFPSDELTAEQAMKFLERMTRIRHFELRVNQLYLSAKMPGLAHLYAGQEAVAVGVCSALRRDDVITSTHRGHGHCLAKGAAVDLMFAELLGKEPGYCHGKGGSMHIADPETGNLGANAIVAGSAGIATGAAMSAKLQGTDRVAACFFGEGAHGQGVLYEVMNMASLWKLPVIYVCENNLYNEYTHYGETRAGDGPTFIECRTYRFFGHHVGDVDRSYYRTKQEEEEWRSSRDPLRVLAAWMSALGYADEVGLEALDRRVAAEVEEGERFALEAPYPDPTEVDRHVYP